MPATSGPAPTMRVGVPSLGWDDHRPFLGAPTDQPMERLVRVRADGSLEPVAVGALADVPRMYCFVHGWAPGSQAAADVIRAQTGRIPLAWDPGMADMYGISLAEAYLPLLTALAGRDPDAGVLWYSWVDDSSTPGQVLAASQSLAHTQANGSRMALALLGAGGGRLPRVQLIGHSHGCVVACHAGLALPQAPDQLTLLDCPEDWFSRAGGAAGLLHEILPRLEPGRLPGQVFIDSYASLFGRSYHRRSGLSDVVDVRVTGGLRRRERRDRAGEAHEYAVDWYAETVRRGDPRCGFGWSVLAADRAGAGAGQPGFDPRSLAAGYMVGADGSPIPVARRRSTPSEPKHEVYPLGVGDLELNAARPDVLVAIDLPDADLVQFDYQITAAGRRSRVEGAVQRVLAFTGGPDHARVPSRGRYLRLPGDRDRAAPVLLQFRLAEPAAGTTATINGLQALRTGAKANYDTTRTAVTAAVAGAVAGSATTLAVQALVHTIRRTLTTRG